MTHAHAPMLEIIEDVIPAEVRKSDTEAGSVSALYAMSLAMDNISKIESLRFDGVCTLDLAGLDSLFIEAKKTTNSKQAADDFRKLEVGMG
ncbi:hypothetical protein BGZ83_011519 [Gryganskiella cystojenkinii]|nr:hypothetical protein BGZ83_011519 [Gryganskiella cystojenkinii]